MTTPTERDLSDALRDLVAAQPFEPDLTAIERRAIRLRKRTRTVRTAGIVGVGMVVVAVAVGAVATIHPATAIPSAQSPTVTTSPAPNPNSRLLALSNEVANLPHLPGDATLVGRDDTYANGRHSDVYDLYADNGIYYFADQRTGLPAQVRSDNDPSGGMFGREATAARHARTGDLAAARLEMSNAPDVRAGKNTVDDNYLWEDSMDALLAGSGDPQARAGALTLLASMPEVSVTQTSLGGTPTLTLTATAPAVPDGYQESLTIDARTGLPIQFHGGEIGHPAEATVDYVRRRVTLADVAAGRF